MGNKDIERRYLPAAEVRIEGEPDAPKIVGYAAVFGKLSVDLFGFREKIAKGAFSRALKEGQDVRALFNHDPSLILGRTKSGTLSLREDDKGLRYEITPPDTTIGHDAVESIRRGDIDGSSFAFVAKKEDWEGDEKESTRTVLDVDLRDVSPATYPAYPDTTVAMRSLDEWREAQEETGDSRSAKDAMEMRLRLTETE